MCELKFINLIFVYIRFFELYHMLISQAEVEKQKLGADGLLLFSIVREAKKLIGQCTLHLQHSFDIIYTSLRMNTSNNTFRHVFHGGGGFVSK